MTAELPVHISREGLHSVEVPDAIEVEGSFVVRLINHGQSLHVHLHLDDALSEVAMLDAGNHFVEGQSERHIRVDVDTERVDKSLLGKLKIAAAHGSKTRWVDVTVSEPEPIRKEVEVDESLAKPQPKQDDPPLVERPEFLALGLSAVGLLVAGIAGLAVGNMLVVLGAVVGFVGILITIASLDNRI